MKGGKTSLYETLKRQILTLELPPDHDLDEASLSEAYGISRTPVRDVLRQLAAEGYIDIRENRGARVIPMDHATLRDFFLVAPMIYEAVGGPPAGSPMVSRLRSPAEDPCRRPRHPSWSSIPASAASPSPWKSAGSCRPCRSCISATTATFPTAPARRRRSSSGSPP